ncbi:hypothetical protein MMC18_008730 [Xylographa bjoerkii]|nr:hypothetical protein [Xylographa bjoerkii]
MQLTSVLVGSATLFAIVAIAAPVPQIAAGKTINVTFKNGDGDSANTFEVTPDVLFLTAGTGESSGVAATIADPAAVCQAFSDAAATKPLGNQFTSLIPGSFTNLANGGVDSVLADAVPIGAFLCSESAAGLAKDIAALTRTSTSSSTTTSSSSSTGTVRVELQTDAETFVQGEIPTDGSIFLTADSIFGNRGTFASLVNATGVNLSKVSCVAFTDVAAKQDAGVPFTAANGGAALSASTIEATIINAIVCSAST